MAETEIVEMLLTYADDVDNVVEVVNQFIKTASHIVKQTSKFDEDIQIKIQSETLSGIILIVKTNAIMSKILMTMLTANTAQLEAIVRNLDMIAGTTGEIASNTIG